MIVLTWKINAKQTEQYKYDVRTGKRNKYPRVEMKLQNNTLHDDKCIKHWVVVYVDTKEEVPVLNPEPFQVLETILFLNITIYV